MKKASLLIVLIFSFVFTLSYGQEKTTKTIEPSIEVKAAFERDFPKEIPKWSQDYGGEERDQIRFTATFKTNTSEGLAVYNQLGELKAYETLIPIGQIPRTSLLYLDQNYDGYKIQEAAETMDENGTVTYEIGIIRDRLFYDCVFDKTGGFLKIVEKD